MLLFVLLGDAREDKEKEKSKTFHSLKRLGKFISFRFLILKKYVVAEMALSVEE